MMKQFFFSLRFALLALMLGTFISATGTVAINVNITIDGAIYRVIINGYGSGAVADSAYVVDHVDGYSGAINIPANITFSYTSFDPVMNCDITKDLTCPVKVMECDAFTYSDISSLSIAESVRIHHSGACSFLMDCKNLTHVNVTRQIPFHRRCFRGCSSLESINIRDDYTIISEELFYGCSSLTSTNIPAGVRTIEQYAFAGCTSLTSINIPDGVVIKRGAFSGAGLTSVTIPENVEWIYAYAFMCPYLKELVWNCVNCKNWNYENDQRGNDRGEIPMGPWEVPIFPWSVEHLVIGPNVKEIGYAIFDWQSGPYPTKLTWNAIHFEGGWNLPADSVEEVIIGGGVEYLPSSFVYRSKITSVSIPNSVTHIGDYAFCDCWKLTEFPHLPSSITTIANGLFSGCTGLTNVTIPNQIKTIGESAFSYCIGLTSVTIPKQITFIGGYAFGDCTGLKTLYWNAKNCQYDSNYNYGPFNGCENLTDIIIGSEVSSIGGKMFQVMNYYDSIKTVTCNALVPPVISEECFTRETYNNATLYVPKGSEEFYQNATGWKEFNKCIAIGTNPGGGEDEPLRGDVNGDGEVSIADVGVLIDYLLTDDASLINVENADANGHGEVDIDDLSALIDFLLTGHW